jgi:hypothetical protein
MRAGWHPVFFSGMGEHTISTDPGKSKFLPRLIMPSSPTYLPADRWWTQTVFVLNGEHTTRQQIVLGAADTGGGAHVDKSLDPDYEKVARNGALGMYEHSSPSGITFLQPVTNVHLACLRQMGFELLKSPELVNLAKRT